MDNDSGDRPPSLTTKERIDSLLNLADASWRDFDTRRAAEWKVTMGLWTAQALFAGLVIRSDVKLALTHVELLFLLGVFAAIVGIYSLWWTRGLRDRNASNLQDAHHLWNLVQDELAIKSPRYLRGGGRPTAHWTNWSHGSQIAITLLLVLLDVWCVWTKRG